MASNLPMPLMIPKNGTVPGPPGPMVGGTVGTIPTPLASNSSFVPIGLTAPSMSPLAPMSGTFGTSGTFMPTVTGFTGPNIGGVAPLSGMTIPALGATAPTTIPPAPAPLPLMGNPTPLPPPVATMPTLMSSSASPSLPQAHLPSASPSASPAQQTSSVTNDAPPPMRVTRSQARPSRAENEMGDEEDEEVCYICGGTDDQNKLVVCDRCDHPFHIYCLKPPLKFVPQGEWFCKDCLHRRERLVTKVRLVMSRSAEKTATVVADEASVRRDTFQRWFLFEEADEEDLTSAEVCELIEKWLEKVPDHLKAPGALGNVPVPTQLNAASSGSVGSKTPRHVSNTSAEPNGTPTTTTASSHNASSGSATPGGGASSSATPSGAAASGSASGSGSGSGSGMPDPVFPSDVAKESPFFEYGCCRPEEVLARTRYVMARDGIPNDVVARESGLSEDVVQMIREGDDLGDSERDQAALSAWLFRTDQKFSAHVFRRVNSHDRVSAQKVARAMGVSAVRFQNWLQTTLALDDRESIDNILITKFPNLTKTREGVFVKDVIIPSGPNVGLLGANEPAEPEGRRRQSSVSNKRARPSTRSSKKRQQPAGGSTPTAATGGGGSGSGRYPKRRRGGNSGDQSKQPSLATALQHVTSSNGMYAGDPMLDEGSGSPRQSHIQQQHDGDSPAAGDASPPRIRTRARHRKIIQQRMEEQEKQERVDEQMASAFTPVHSNVDGVPTNPPARLGPQGPSHEVIAMCQAKINFDNIVMLLKAERYDEAREVAMTASMLMHSHCTKVL